MSLTWIMAKVSVMTICCSDLPVQEADWLVVPAAALIPSLCSCWDHTSQGLLPANDGPTMDTRAAHSWEHFSDGRLQFKGSELALPNFAGTELQFQTPPSNLPALHLSFTWARPSLQYKGSQCLFWHPLHSSQRCWIKCYLVTFLKTESQTISQQVTQNFSDIIVMHIQIAGSMPWK